MTTKDIVQEIGKLLRKGLVLYDVCNDYTLDINDCIQAARWHEYTLHDNGTLQHTVTDEIHYYLGRAGLQDESYFFAVNEFI